MAFLRILFALAVIVKTKKIKGKETKEGQGGAIGFGRPYTFSTLITGLRCNYKCLQSRGQQ